MIVFIFCLLLIAGIMAGQIIPVEGFRGALHLLTSACLGYIMIEVGMHFSMGRKKLRDYGFDTVVATLCAVLPALLWFIYFLFALKSEWKPSLLSGLSSAPTSAGVLFSMLLAAGLSRTWVFEKARVLAVLDDLVTIILLMLASILLLGLQIKTLIVLAFILFFIFASFRFQNTIHWPSSQKWFMLYAALLTLGLFGLERVAHIHLEILMPAFAFGCMLYSPTGHQEEKGPSRWDLDTGIKGLFMFLVGLSFPRISFEGVSLSETVGHVLVLTILANVGKCFALFCYRKEVSFKQRLALSITLFPRGEVGAAVLLIGLGYGLGGYTNTLAMISLALNLVLTGVFVAIVIQILNKERRCPTQI